MFWAVDIPVSGKVKSPVLIIALLLLTIKEAPNTVKLELISPEAVIAPVVLIPAISLSIFVVVTPAVVNNVFLPLNPKLELIWPDAVTWPSTSTAKLVTPASRCWIAFPINPALELNVPDPWILRETTPLFSIFKLLAVATPLALIAPSAAMFPVASIEALWTPAVVNVKAVPANPALELICPDAVTWPSASTAKLVTPAVCCWIKFPIICSLELIADPA